MEDSPWKVNMIAKLVRAEGIAPKHICDVGCGAGAVLAGMHHEFPEAKLFGFDVAPDAAKFWPQYSNAEIDFRIGDFLDLSSRSYDLVLVLDVVEHVADPFEFLVRLRGHGNWFMFHFPLDLSALNVLREKPLIDARDRVGHIHYFTKGLALALLRECGYEVRVWRYTGAAFSGPRKTWKTRLAQLPRWLAYCLGKDLGVRLVGGETLLVLARPRIDADTPA